MANLDSAAEILKQILFKCGEITDGTSKYQSVALEYMNTIYQKIVARASQYNLDVGEAWMWARGSSPLILQLQPFIEGSVAVTLNSATGTFSAIPTINGSNVSLAGWRIWINQGNEYYKIKTHTAGQTAFTLDGAFNDPTGGAYSFTAFQIEYTLTVAETGGISSLAGPMEVYRNQTYEGDQEGKIYQSSLEEMNKNYPLSLIEVGVPTEFSIVSIADGSYVVRFNKYVDALTRVEIPYVPVPDDLTTEPDCIPILPRKFRDALVYGPASILAKDNNDDRAETYEADFAKILESMKRDDQRERNKASKHRGQMIPRADQIRRNRKIYNI